MYLTCYEQAQAASVLSYAFSELSTLSKMSLCADKC